MAQDLRVVYEIFVQHKDQTLSYANLPPIGELAIVLVISQGGTKKIQTSIGRPPCDQEPESVLQQY